MAVAPTTNGVKSKKEPSGAQEESEDDDDDDDDEVSCVEHFKTR